MLLLFLQDGWSVLIIASRIFCYFMYIVNITRTLIRFLLQDDKTHVLLVPTGCMECPKAGIKDGHYSYFYIALYRHKKGI